MPTGLETAVISILGGAIVAIFRGAAAVRRIWCSAIAHSLNSGRLGHRT
jgi:hypothetical protein